MEVQRRGADEVTDDDDMGCSEDGQNDFGSAADSKSASDPRCAFEAQISGVR
jgi:hypothetical protein